MVQSDEKGGSWHWHASRAALRYGRYLVVPKATDTDVQELHPKIRGNEKVFHSSRDVLAQFLGCRNEDLERLFLLHSRDDYARLAALLLNAVSGGVGKR